MSNLLARWLLQSTLLTIKSPNVTTATNGAQATYIRWLNCHEKWQSDNLTYVFGSVPWSKERTLLLWAVWSSFENSSRMRRMHFKDFQVDHSWKNLQLWLRLARYQTLNSIHTFATIHSLLLLTIRGVPNNPFLLSHWSPSFFVVYSSHDQQQFYFITICV